MNRSTDLATIRRARFTRPPPAGAAFVITVVEGPDAGLVASLDASSPTRALLGTSPVCTIRLGDREVSRRHVALSVVDKKLVVLDLGSTNGTTINGVLVREAALRGGEAIRIGASVLAVRCGEAAAVELGRASSFGRVIGESRAMKRIYPALERLARSDHAVLLEGEAGTGKELVAEEIHRASERCDEPFVALEASTIPAGELDARLANAAAGMLFVDEVGNVSRGAQAALRKLAVAGSNVRIIAATRRDLDRDVAQGRFEEDLYYALAGGRVELPALRDREGDVSLLARHFWSELASPGAPRDLPEDFLARFEGHAWPGNVRELRTAVLARMTTGELRAARSLDFVHDVLEEDLPLPLARERVIADFERRYVERVLARHDGNVTRAARASGVAHRYFQTVKARTR